MITWTECLKSDIEKMRELAGGIEIALQNIETEMVTKPGPGAAPLDTRVLDIPFVSQLGDKANLFHNDCGAACGCMVTKSYWPGDGVTPNAFYKMTGKKRDVYLTVGDLRRVLYDRFGIATNWILKPEVKKWIDGGLAVIALISYAPIQDWKKNPNSNFRHNHYVVVAGYNRNHTYILDPLYPPDSCGWRWIPSDVFYNAWSSCRPANGAIVTATQIGTEIKDIETIRVVHPYGVNVRAGPDISDTILGGEPAGKILQVYEMKTGTGTDRWARIGQDRWIAMNYDGTILAVSERT